MPHEWEGKSPEAIAALIRDKARQYNEGIMNVEQVSQPYHLELERQHVDTVQSLALVCGAIAALSLTIFGTPLPHITNLLLFGVVLLLLNVIYVFFYLVRRISRSYRTLRDIKSGAEPLRARVRDAMKVANGDLTPTEWFQRDENMHDNWIKELATRVPTEEQLVHNDDIAVGVLGIAIILIVASVVLPRFSCLQPFLTGWLSFT